ncbi:hypothetical protein C4K13_3580 [Pseudomonas chlororaphis subsp. aureofaciens]|nr:hypothetical protein C4K13_3580 [Pseudomonas chlororaphis subsp. aureofaciens]
MCSVGRTPEEGDFLAAKIIDALILLASNAPIFLQLRHEN